MKIRIFAATLLSISCSAIADLVAHDELNELSAAESDERTNWNPEVSVHLGSGSATMPYGPPGLEQYKTKTRYTEFSLGMGHQSLGGDPNKKLHVGLSLRNNFPSAGRQYDLQAVSWIDVTSHVAAIGRFPVWRTLAAQWSFGVEAHYERFHYPKGLAAIYGLPLRAGGGFVYPFQVFGDEVWISAEAQTSYFAFARTAVKYDSLPVGNSVQSDRVSFVPNRKVVGWDYEYSLDISFSTGPVRQSHVDFSEHVISLVWHNRTRKADDYIKVTEFDGTELSSSQLDFEQSGFGLAWTERF